MKPLDIEDISAQLDNYDAELSIKTGCTLLGIACHAIETEKNVIQDLIVSVKVGVVPMTCGEGIISGFADAIKNIASHMGFKAFATRHTDISGIAEAIENKADILMMADDNRFVALHLKHHRFIDNSSATGKGYAAGLDLMNNGVKGEKCLVIGCGPVGQSAASALLNFGAIVSVYDINQQRCMNLAEELNRSFDRNIKIESALESALKNYRLLIEATDAANVISEKNITPKTYIAAPGMPLGLNATAYEKVYDRLLHDPLQIGAATMLVSAVIKDLC